MMMMIGKKDIEHFLGECKCSQSAADELYKLIRRECYTITDLKEAFEAGIDKGRDEFDPPSLNSVGHYDDTLFQEWFSDYFN